MMYLHKNSANTVVFTATEKSTVDPAYWLIEFTHQMSGEVVTVTGSDTTTAPHRFNEMVITVSSGDPLQGYAELQDGFHMYRILEMSTPGLVADSPEVVLETGKAYVFDPSAPATPVEATYTGKDTPVWQG